ncbi:glucose-6-phosphate dehydrogenase [Candidatus Woesearchaeota archaeon]|nr:glucose-6-phosphate dehydrogenase [Candidatus Woesearchaeota archaeon]
MSEHHCVFSIFGATGDLTNRKLLPAFYHLEREGYLKESFRIVAIARKDKSDEEYRNEASNSIRKFSRRKVNEDIIKKLVSRIRYLALDIANTADYANLKRLIENVSGQSCGKCERIFYLAIPSYLFAIVVNNLKRTNLAEKARAGKPYNRVMFEKPFGNDFESAEKLNNAITKVFAESQIYRIDHYMAKELVQNLVVLRFANSIFEPLWNKEYIDHVQITVAESLGVEGRGEYYDNAGAIRDVMQNHMMQLLTLVGMEAPKSLNAEDLRSEKVKVLKAISKFTKGKAKKIAIIGQYSEGEIDGRKVAAYKKENEVRKDSGTETYVALKLELGNALWKGVPFYLRTGKRLKERATEIVIVYKNPPSELFKASGPEKNMLVVRVQPYEGVTLQFNAKVPGNKVIIDNVDMDFCHECKFGPNSPEAYERLLYDVILGDQTLFTGWEEVANSWQIFDVLNDAFKNSKPIQYEAGTWGPAKADKLIEKDGRKWVEPKRPSYAELVDKQNIMGVE